MRVKKDLSLGNESEVRSLEEDLEEVLTLHRLDLFEELGGSLKTSNCIESLIEQRTDMVDYWKNSTQKQQWLGTALLDIEPRWNRIRRYRCLPERWLAIQREFAIRAANEVVPA